MNRQPTRRLVSLERAAPPPRTPKPLLSLTDAAKALGVGLTTIQRLVADGTLYSIPVGVTGKYRRIPIAEVEKFRSGGYDHRPSGAGQG